MYLRHPRGIEATIAHDGENDKSYSNLIMSDTSKIEEDKLIDLCTQTQQTAKLNI